MLTLEGKTAKNIRKRKINGKESIPIKECKMKKLPQKLCETFFNTPSYILAQNLLGKILIRKIDTITCRGRIVETECYPGSDDKASCTFNGKRTPAMEALYMSPGTAYVYMTYGMYYCVNISASEPEAGVLIRALEPIEGIDHMKKWRIESKSMWIEDDPDYKVEKVVHTTRIGINSAGKEWAQKMYRFYILGNSYVSKRDLLKEGEISEQTPNV